MTPEELTALRERDVKALQLIAVMLGVVAADLITVTAALVTTCEVNQIPISDETRARLTDTVTRLVKLRDDADALGDTLDDS